MTSKNSISPGLMKDWQRGIPSGMITAYVWQDEARLLICAGNVLLDSCEKALESSCVERSPFEPNETHLWRPIMVLYALAVENLFKAIIIARGENPAPNNELETWFKTHNLTAHAKRAKLSFTPNRGLLETLREFIESGKYPFGKNPQSGTRTDHFIHPYYPETIFELLENMEDDLRKILPDKSLPKTQLCHMCRCGSSSNKESAKKNGEPGAAPDRSPLGSSG